MVYLDTAMKNSLVMLVFVRKKDPASGTSAILI